MADNNTRDVTPDDFNHPDNLDVPAYTGASDDAPGIDTRTGKAAPTEIFPRSAKKMGSVEEVRLRANPSAQPAPAPAPEPATEYIPAAAPEPAPVAEPAQQYETVALEREPAYIAPAEPAYAETGYAETVPVEETYVEPAAPVDARRGTIDFGLLLLRLAVGAFLILDALAVFFRLGGNEGIAGLESAYAGYPYGNGLAIVVPTLELAAGVFLVLGLLTPVAAAVAIAVTGFLALHTITTAGVNFNVFSWEETVWVPVMLLFAALAVQFTGPGLYGVDAQRGWARRPLASSWICALVGLAAAGLMWWFGTNINPFAGMGV